jgi:threonine dehydrogenase-like Zn-dependent dehydrogenase
MTIGHEFMGRIIAKGSEVSGFTVGQRVVSGSGVSNCQLATGKLCDWCREGKTNLCAEYYTHGLNAPGALAERITVRADICYAVPEELSDEAAAMAQPTAIALHSVRRSGIQPGRPLAVQGVGGIGSFVVGALAYKGMGPIVAIDIDRDRLETAGKLGATTLVDARDGDPAEQIRAATRGDGVDVFFEATGIPTGPSIGLQALRRGGTLMVVGLQKEPTAIDLRDLVMREITVQTSLAHVFRDDIPEAVEMLAATDFATIVFDRLIGIEAVLEGLEAIRENRAKGKVLVDPQSSSR